SFSCTGTWCRRYGYRRAGSPQRVVSTPWRRWPSTGWCGGLGWQPSGWPSAVRGIGEDGTRYRSAGQSGGKSGAPPPRWGRGVEVVLSVQPGLLLLPGFGDHVALVQGLRLSAWPVELLRVDAVGDVPGVLAAGNFVQAVRPADPDHAPDAGVATADQGAAEEVRQGPPAEGAGDAEAAARTRVQSDTRLLADAGADPGVPGAVPRAAVLQPDHHRYRTAGALSG